jgi:hypothetical protein
MLYAGAMDDLAKTCFWMRVQKGPDNVCWPWLGGRTEQGYGRARVTGWPEKRAHRVAYELTHGEISDYSRVTQTCENLACCNPAHLKHEAAPAPVYAPPGGALYTIAFTVKLHPSQLELLREGAAALGVSMQQFVRDAVRLKLAGP